MMALRYTVSCNGEPVGFVELSAPDEGSAAGLLEPLPAFQRVGAVLERGRRLEEEATMRLLRPGAKADCRDRPSRRRVPASRTSRRAQ